MMIKGNVLFWIAWALQYEVAYSEVIVHLPRTSCCICDLRREGGNDVYCVHTSRGFKSTYLDKDHTTPYRDSEYLSEHVVVDYVMYIKGGIRIRFRVQTRNSTCKYWEMWKSGQLWGDEPWWGLLSSCLCLPNATARIASAAGIKVGPKTIFFLELMWFG